MTPKPAAKPARPWFSAGPTAKRPGWALANLPTNLMGRGIRAPEVVERFAHGLRLTREVLGPPDDHVMLYTPGSDTGAVEAALWCMLGERPVQVVAYENFGLTWLADVKEHLGLEPEALTAPWGELPDLSRVDPKKDVVFPWNGTTSGVRVPNGDWIADDREGLTICDATSAAFAMDLPWDKLDVVTYSWQKVLGGEGAHGVLVLSPRAVARLESHTPAWPMPKLFRMTKGGKLIAGIFEGETINTPSMLVVEDALDGLKWSESIGGLPALMGRCRANLSAIEKWVAGCDAVAFLAARPEIRSCTSVCLRIVAPWFARLDAEGQQKAQKAIVALLEKEGVAYDLGAYRDAPAGLRIWAGATVETSDIEALLPWIEWALAEAAKDFA